MHRKVNIQLFFTVVILKSYKEMKMQQLCLEDNKNMLKKEKQKVKNVNQARMFEKMYYMATMHITYSKELFT